MERDYEWQQIMAGRREGMARDAALRGSRLKRPKANRGITRKEFMAYDYERVRRSGVTNMFDVGTVEKLSGLSKDKIFKIVETYGDLVRKYPGVRRI